MQSDPDRSLSDEATFAGRQRPQRADVSLGDERTVGAGLSGRDTIIDGIEVVDLETRYRIEGTLGQGGMGKVFLATDRRLGRKVAIKRLLGEAARSKTNVSRFLTEAKSIAALNHPNVVQIYDYGRAKDGPFLSMEYVEGGSLLDRCSKSRLPLEEVIDLACQLCNGLAKAHDLGIIHRDIKPSNILLTSDGIPKLADFGLAKASAGDRQMTVTGKQMGTPDFMPPEQQRDARSADHRSDLWSLAATVYQMATGRSPKIIRLKDVPTRLEEVLAKALEEDKSVRYQTAREFRDALKSARDGGSKVTGRARAEDVLQEGQCKACGTVTSDLTKKFCRNPQCGASLRVACLKCDAQMPVWDGVCGECGGNQPALLEAKRKTLEAKRAEAEALLVDLAFDDAIGLANEAASESRIELADLMEWAATFVATATVERDRQRSAAAGRLQEANKHIMASDYPAAIRAIEMIPEQLRAASATALLADCRAWHDESDKLIAEIRVRLNRKEVVGLLTLVTQAVKLRGDRADLRTLRDTLVDLDLRRFATARAALESGDTQAAVQAMPEYPESDECYPAVNLRSWIATAASVESDLVALVGHSKSDGSVDAAALAAILQAGELCIRVNPHSTKAIAVVQQARALLAKHSLSFAQEYERKLTEEARRQQDRLNILSHPLIRNSIGMELRFLPGGSMSPENAVEDTTAQSRSAALINPFCMGIHQVTNAQWKRVMGDPPSTWQGSDHPVEQVTWHEANEFCRQLSQLPQESAAGRVYRLPTEAEWDYACRAGTKADLWLGEQWVWHEYAWFQQNSDGQTHPVGQKNPNPWGFYDMCGNVHEWCSDTAADNDRLRDMHVIKGGSIQFGRVGDSHSFLSQSASMRCFDTGLRLAMDVLEARQGDERPCQRT
jgi:serine/threonine protein kinase/formylglycine-generating enzyme required for sulfatase activity